MQSRQEYSAGGIVYKKEDNRVSVALIYREFHTDWTLPKGHIEPNETPQQAAIREVREETGLEATIVQLIGETDYSFRAQDNIIVHKRVSYFLMEYVRDHETYEKDEVDEIRWVPIDEATKLLTFVKDRELVLKCKAILTA
jgi:8-oxo-dGTP diphosphatase